LLFFQLITPIFSNDDTCLLMKQAGSSCLYCKLGWPFLFV